MKIALYSIWTLLVLASAAVRAQSPAWRAASAITNTSAFSSEVQATAADGNGNLYKSVPTMGASYWAT